jgi:hypothetical protein
VPQSQAYSTVYIIFKIYHSFLDKEINNKDGALIAAIWLLEPKEYLKLVFAAGRVKSGSQRQRMVIISSALFFFRRYAESRIPAHS